MSEEMTPGTRAFLERGRKELGMEPLIPGQNAPALGGAAKENRCFCGEAATIGWVGDQRVRICRTGDHVVLGYIGKVYVHVENPQDVIEATP